MKANTLKPGLVVTHRDELWNITKMVHGTPGNKRGFYQITMKSLARGNVITERFSTDDDLDVAYLDTKNMEYLYQDGDLYCFMDSENFEQHMLDKALVGDSMPYIKENDPIKMRLADGKPVNIELPAAVLLRVAKTDPGAKGNTVNNTFKPAELETGLTIKVPMYITEGELVKVDTRSGEFLERGKE